MITSIAVRFRVIRPCACVVALSAASLSMNGCRGGASTGGGARAISLDEFVGSSPADLGNDRPPDNNAPVVADAEPPDLAADGAATSDTDSTSDAPPESAPDAAPLPREPVQPGQEIVVDSLVGQINGRPIFANEFFEPLDAELRTESARQTLTQFTSFLIERIGRRMNEILQNELLIAQAENRLTPEQQQGLFQWLTRREEDLVSQRGSGSRAEAIQRMLDEGDVTLQGQMQEDRERALISMIIEQEIRPRVIVSWRDVERAYRQNSERFNPPGALHLSTIILNPVTETERIEDVQRRLAAGEPFTDVAASINGRPLGDSYGALSIAPGGLATLENENLWGDMVAQLKTMQVGEVRGPFDMAIATGRRVAWVQVMSLTYPPGKSIYDPEVQTLLWERLRALHFGIEQARYFDELLTDGIYRDVGDMVDRLVRLALERYR